MAKRVVLGGVVAGVLVFVWGAVSHMVLGLGSVGIRQIPGEEAVLRTLGTAIPEPGFYFFPWMDETPGLSPEAKKAAEEAWKKRYREGPHGILVERPGQGEDPMSPRLLAIQAAIDIAAGLLAASIVGLLGGGCGFFSRLVSVTLLGVFAGVVTNLPYWNWYGFPSDFTLAALADHAIGWFIGGLALAGIVRRPVPAVPRV